MRSRDLEGSTRVVGGRAGGFMFRTSAVKGRAWRDHPLRAAEEAFPKRGLDAFESFIYIPNQVLFILLRFVSSRETDPSR